MNLGYIVNLNEIVKMLLKDKNIKEAMENLSVKIKKSNEPFIWNIINKDPYSNFLPPEIESIWLFVLKKNAPSIAHHHPNSIQHTVMIKGKGKVKIGDGLRNLKIFNPLDLSNEDIWCVIDKNIPHEFFPEEEMIVFSFHTCAPDKLIEIKCDSGKERVYDI